MPRAPLPPSLTTTTRRRTTTTTTPPSSFCFVRLLFVAAALYISLLSSMAESRALRICTACLSAAECNTPPNDCVWGVARDECGRLVCAKGPGHRCSIPGEPNLFGACGEGMYCRKQNERPYSKVCHGCYGDTLDCYEKFS